MTKNHSATLNSDELDSQLAKDLLKERLYDAGLTAQGDSGFVITSGTESLYKGAWLVGVTGFLDRSGDEEAYPEFGIKLSASAGICKELGIFHDMEVSISVPYFMNEISSDSESGMGDPRITLKTKLLKGRPLSDIPDISFVLSAVLPGDEDGGYSILDQGGIEGGFIFGAKVPDSSGSVNFQLYLDVRYAIYDYIGLPDGEEDQFITTHFGISFPVLGLNQCFLLLEGGRTVRNAQFLNGNDYSVAIRYKTEEYNWTVGILINDYEKVYPSARRLYLMYDHKF